MNPINCTLILLISSLLIGIVALAGLWKRGQDGMRLRSVMLMNFLIAYQMSALAHVLRWSDSRGFYEALAGSPLGATTGLVQASAATLLGTIALVMGLLGRSRKSAPVSSPAEDTTLLATHRPLVFSVATALTLISLWALRKVVAAVAGSGAERVIAVTGGNARYAALAGWFPWGLSIVALCLRNKRRSPLAYTTNAVLLGATCLAIAAASSWSGGRSSVLFDCFPIIVLFLPRMGVSKWLFGVLGGIGLTLYVWAQTLVRSPGEPFDLWGLVDWQWGRFSMGAWAFKYTEYHGLLLGETYLSGLLVVPGGLSHFFGIDLADPYRPVVAFTGEYLRGSADKNFIVPGSMAELILNFGVVGVIVGYYLFGRVTGFLADLYRRTRSDLQKLLVAAISTTILSQVVMQFEAFLQTIILGQLPLWSFVLAEWVLLKVGAARATQAVSGESAILRRM